MSVLRQVTPTWAKRTIRQAVWQYRRATSSKRTLPDFIIIGAQKSGTTSLYSYLSQHKQITPSFAKEVHYFDGGVSEERDNYLKGEQWYRSYFQYEKINEENLSFEASPLYLFHPLVPKRISDLVPQIKMIAVLRNPTERAISHYFHEKRKKREPLSIQDALKQEESRLETSLETGRYNDGNFIHKSYKKRGLYKEQLERFFQLFSKNQLLVLNSEDLFTKPAQVLTKVYNFLGLETNCIPRDLKPRNVGSNRSKVDADVYEQLDHYYQPHNQSLYELLNEDYEW